MQMKSIFSIILVMMMALGLVLVGCPQSGGGSGDGTVPNPQPGTNLGAGTGTNTGGNVPAELIGVWYLKSVGKNTQGKFCEFTSQKMITYANNNPVMTYDASVSGKTITFTYSSAPAGTMQYSISGGELTFSNGTGGWESTVSMTALAPLIK